MRTFVAIALPDSVTRAAESVQARLKKTGADVTWVRPECMHLTVQFLGEIDQHLADRVSAALDMVARKHAPMTLTTGDIGAFPSLDQPRVLWVGIGQGATEIAGIIEECGRSLEQLGVEREKRDPMAHITLGRVRSARNRLQLRQELESLKHENPLNGLSFTAHSLTLYRSTLSPRGSVYTRLHEAIFAIT